MGKYTQANRFMRLATPLGPDALLLDKLDCREAMSEPFDFKLEMLAEQPVAFEKILGQAATVTLDPPASPRRYFNGIVAEFRQRGRVLAADGKVSLLRYQARIVPRFWLLGLRVQSRVWQHLSVPDILKQLLKDEWQLDVRFTWTGSYPERDRCMQYRESDLDFASRLMEDEGIHYYFVHADGSHQMVISDGVTPSDYPEVAAPTTVNFDDVEGGTRNEPRVHNWEKVQRIRSCKYTVRDHCFQMPDKRFDADHPILDQVTAGTAQHPLPGPDASRLEIYDYPGRFSQWFDGIGKDGSDQASNLQNLFTENARVAKLRMQQESVECLTIEGTGNSGQFVPGARFTLARHPDADGAYLLLAVEHEASLEGAYLSGGEEPRLRYENRFRCLPADLPYRPNSDTPRPHVHGTQTATVVGPSGEEIFTDKFGRVKVQFNWDRLGQFNSDSSCWLRVAQASAGKGFGMITIPRVGQEVIVDFLDGDPDKPSIIGSVYNTDQPPPFTLPDDANLTSLKSHSIGGSAANFSGLVIRDQAGSEHLQLHAERDMTFNSENNQTVTVGADHDVTVYGSHQHSIGGDQQVGVQGNHEMTVGNHYKMTVGAAPPGSAGGSGSGGGDPSWIPPWDWSTNSSSAPPHSEGYEGAYTLNVLGSSTMNVAGNYDCVIEGIQNYTTFGAYLTFVAGMSLTTILGAAVNIIAPFTINYFRGWTFNLHETGWTSVGQAPISIVGASTITLDAGLEMAFTSGASISGDTAGAITLDASIIRLQAGVIQLQAGASMVSITPDGILLDVGGMNFVFVSTQGVYIGGLSQEWTNDLQLQITATKNSVTSAVQQYI
ncbi:hypothetical protein AYO40_05155 [Planctomycetaceae bacterium SCGC AG-212-D15]|nr:hypothetical protein AYO40_05155 [Planctomycetaceae bacterium SCGC AG-212-D15]